MNRERHVLGELEVALIGGKIGRFEPPEVELQPLARLQALLAGY
jgi:hypothetical protein